MRAVLQNFIPQPHVAIHRQLEVQETTAILERFGKRAATARHRYRQFISEGIKTGQRDDLVGGGLKRSQGERQKSDYDSYDARVLGGGNFVDGLRQEFTLRDRMKSAISLNHLVEIVSAALTLDPDSIRRPSKSRAPAAARGIICHLAIFEFGYKGREVGTFLHLGPTGVCLAAKRGDKILKDNSKLLKEIMCSIDK